MEFNWYNGAYKATHKGHISHDNPNESRFFPEKLSATQLETECTNVLFERGHRVVLRDESIFESKNRQLPSLDLLFDGIVLDIRSITEHNTNTIRNAIVKKNDQIRRAAIAGVEHSDQLCLYFHISSYFDKERMPQIIDEYKNLTEKNGGTVRIKKIYCVLNNGEIYEYNV